MDYYDQVESIRETCSGDPANNFCLLLCPLFLQVVLSGDVRSEAEHEDEHDNKEHDHHHTGESTVVQLPPQHLDVDVLKKNIRCWCDHKCNSETSYNGRDLSTYFIGRKTSAYFRRYQGHVDVSESLKEPTTEWKVSRELNRVQYSRG